MDHTAIARGALEGLDVDETIVDYIGSMLEDPESRDKETLVETLSAFLPDEEAAAKIVDRLLAALKGDGAAATPPAAPTPKVGVFSPAAPPPAPAKADVAEEVDASKMTSAQKRALRKQRQARAKSKGKGPSADMTGEAEEAAKVVYGCLVCDVEYVSCNL